MDGKCEFGNYWDHIESWYPHVTADNVLMVTYEDMKKNIARELGNIGNFIGGEWGQKLQSGERLQTVRIVYKQSDISYHRQINIRWPKPPFFPFCNRTSYGVRVVLPQKLQKYKFITK